MTIKCLKCGQINDDNAHFCINCGNSLLGSSSTPNSPQNDFEFFAQQLYENKVHLPTRDCPVIMKRAEEAVLVLPREPWIHHIPYIRATYPWICDFCEHPTHGSRLL